MSKTLLLCALTAGFVSSLNAVAATLPESCGPAETQYKVKLDKKAPLPGAPQGDQARIVFIQVLDGDFSSGPLSRFAADKTWMGADKGASYFAVDVAPGIHHICASRQSGIELERQNVGVGEVQVKAGQTYYLAFKVKREAMGSPEMRTGAQGVPGSSMTSKPENTLDTAELTQLDGDQGARLVSQLPQSVAEKK